MELRDAFDQIHAIRAQLARTERLRSLRAVPVAFSAGLALSAGVAQALWIQEPAAQPLRYLFLWVGAAAISALAAVMEMVHRVRSARLHVGADTARHAFSQFAPSCIVGALLTTFVVARVPELLWLLPGLWQLLFGLGNLAAHQLLPRPVVLVGAGYLAAGSLCLWLQQDALSPWAMAVPFALGQAALAAILWWHLERAGAEVAA